MNVVPLWRDAASSFCIALLVAAVLAAPVFRLLLALKSRQEVSKFAPEGHQKKQGTPTMGGLIVLGGALAALLPQPGSSVPIGLLLGFALVGFLDDFVVPRALKGKRGLGWVPKLVLEAAATVGAFSAGGALARDPVWLGVAVFAVLFCANAYNFADGLDALAGGLLLALAPGFLLLATLWSNPVVAVLVAALCGAMLPFLFLNAPPARVFMGDVGSLPVGALLGWAMAQLAGTSGMGEPARWAVLAVLGLVLVAELVPVPIQIASVKLTGRRVFPRTPIHHAFEHKGWPETRVTWMFLLVQVACSGIAATIALRWGVL
ncbi:MAG: hypothetical protein ACK41F_10315 [Fimbriimonadaceae bacterium]